MPKKYRLTTIERFVNLIMRGVLRLGVPIGFASEDDWIDYRLEHDPRFLARIERARQNLREGRGVRLEDVE